MTRQQIFNDLIIFAINNQNAGRYSGNPPEQIILEFCKLPLSDLHPFWEKASDQTKLLIIKNHEKELMEWISQNA